MTERDWDRAADRYAAAAVADGEPNRWFEELWSAGSRDDIDLPWNRTEPHPALAEFLAGTPVPPAGARAVVVGGALGADAEAVARAGYLTTAFDIAPSAITLARQRYPDSPVDYRVADLLDPPADMADAFDLVVEVFTVQAMPPALRPEAIGGIRRLLAPGGRALLVQYVRGEVAAQDGPPWMLDRAEMESFAGGEFVLASLSRRDLSVRPGTPPVWVGVLERVAPLASDSAG